MAQPRLSKLELQIMEALWTRGPCSVREIQEQLPVRNRPAYTTVQTIIYRPQIRARGHIETEGRENRTQVFQDET